MYAQWPKADQRAADSRAVAEFAAAQELVGVIRSIRAEYGVQPGQSIRAKLTTPSDTMRAALRQLKPTVQRLAKVSELAVVHDGHRVDQGSANGVVSDGTGVTIPLGELVDLAQECARLSQEAARLTDLVSAQERKLANEQFVSRAPAEIVQKERDKLAAWRDQVGVLDGKRQRLGCAG
jgi:valyl-tRNA synthetase